MHISSAICVAPVNALNVGDLIALKTGMGVIAGKVTGIAHMAVDLTEEQEIYMTENDLEIPAGKWDLIDEGSNCLVFGEFGPDWGGHIYLRPTTTVAVFPTN